LMITKKSIVVKTDLCTPGTIDLPPPKFQSTVRMSSIYNNISAAGTIKNLLSVGFTQQDAVNELNDNAIDAGANQVRIRLDTTTHTLHVDDDGKGMDQDQLTRALCIHDARPASETIGTKGTGLKAGHCVLSNEEHPTVIISKTAHSPTRYEIDADWPGAILRDHWDPRASRGSEEYRPEWDAGCLNPNHGTTMKIPMPPAKFAEFMASLPTTLKDIGRIYEKYLAAGKVIRVEVDGVPYEPDMSTALGWEGTPAHLRNEVTLDILHNPTTGEKRVYYRHSDTYRRRERTEMVRDNPVRNARLAILRDYLLAVTSEGYVRTATMTLRSTYRPEWNPPVTADGERPAYMPGYTTACRDDRFLRPMPTDFGSDGDYEARRVRAAMRHAIEFTHANDDSFGIQVNKSNLTPANIDAALMETVQRLTKKWASKIYNTHFKVRVEDANAAFENLLKAQIKQLREIARANREVFLEEFREVLEDLPDRLTEARERLEDYEDEEDEDDVE